MTVSRAAPYIVFASLLGAWLSSAASSMPQEPLAGDANVMEHAAEPGEWASDVQQQSRRLKERIASGPPIPRPQRNPFEFRTSRAPAQAARRPEGTAGHAALAAPAGPDLSLIGVAAHQRPDGLVRTAMIATGAGELIMAVAGDVVVGRFTVRSVGADSADLVDPNTGATLRLRLD